VSIVIIGLLVFRVTFFKIKGGATAGGSHFTAAYNKADSHADEADKKNDTGSNNCDDNIHT
jgi:hypothetical protein